MDQSSPALVADPPRTTAPPTTPEPRAKTAARLDADRQVRGLRFALGVSLAIALGVVLTAISIQSGRTVDREGHGWPFSLLFGPVTGRSNLQGWRVVTEPDQLLDRERYADLLVAFTIVDFAYITVYFFLLWAVITTLAHGRWLLAAKVSLGVLVGVDVLENVLALLSWSGVDPRLIVLATRAKWWLLVGIAGLLLLSAGIRAATSTAGRSERDLGSRIKRAYKAVRHQRFAFVPVVALFVLTVLSGTAILEQLPDVMRRWISDDDGPRHAVVSMASTLLVSVALIIAGRYRSGYAARHPSPPPPLTRDHPARPPYLWVWLVGPVLTTVCVLIVLGLGDADEVIPFRFAVFALLPLLLIVLTSQLLRRRWKDLPNEKYPFDRPQTFDERELTAVRLAGNVAGIGIVVVGGLSLIRAFVPLVIVRRSETQADLSRVWLYLVIGLGTVVLPWLVAMVVVRVGAARPERPPTKQHPKLSASAVPDFPLGSWALLLFGLAVFVLLGVRPGLPAYIGVAATAILALGSMAVMLSAVALMIQDRPTAEVFRAVGLSRSPLVTILVLTVILVGQLGGRDSIHDVDRGRPVAAPDETRLTMDRSFDAWLATEEPCLTAVGGRPVRPMLLVAAEGGGIRAAYWTVRGLQAIADTTCGERSALFSAGASGGSVGLTVARFSGTPDAPNAAAAVDAVKQMAAPEILAQATDGTFVRDLVYGANGVPVPRLGETDPFRWKDRARLIEDGWADAPGAGGLDWGDRDFLTPSNELSPTTGQLILNSSDVKHACRVWVSQVSPGRPVTVPGGASFDPERSCDKSPGPGARTIDLFTAYGPFVPGADRESCLGQIRSATAALLTARFPYVTPSAVLGPCPAAEDTDGKAPPYWPRTQLVDGGYIENSGLATITDLSDDWLGLVRDHNAKVLAAPGSADPLVVPIVVFLTNGDHGVVQPAIDSSPVSEVAVPLQTYLRGSTALSGNDALLERARAAVELSGFCPGSAAACADLQNHFPSRVVIVDRVTRPEIGAPLGWVMSQASINSMEAAIVDGQLGTTCRANLPRRSGGDAPVETDRETQPSCRTGYATLGDLVRYYGTRS